MNFHNISNLMRYCEFLHENYAFFFRISLLFSLIVLLVSSVLILDHSSIENLDKAQNGNHEDGDWFYFRAERAK